MSDPWDALRAYLVAQAPVLNAPSGWFQAVDSDGTPLVEIAWGGWSGETQTHIASASKLFCCTLAMRLLDRHVLALDRQIFLDLPEWNVTPKRRITPHMLLSLTAGLRARSDAMADLTISQRREAELAGTDRNQNGTAAPSLMAVPGTVVLYGGLTFEIAGALFEALDGRNYAALLADEIAAPLGLTATVIGNMLADGDPHFGTANPHVPGGIWTTGRDLIRLAATLLRDGTTPEFAPFLSLGSVELMLTDRTGVLPIGASPWGDSAFRYGYGAWIRPTGAASADGAFGVTPLIDRVAGYAAVTMMRANADQESLNAFRLEVERLSREALGVGP